MMLAFLATAAAVQMSASQEQALRLRLGALPALWKLEADIDSLQGYLESPKEAFLQMQKENGPDCECINKNQKGPECECINKAPVVLAKTEAKGPDCECINKNQKGPDCECINKAPVVLAKTEGPDCECINKNQVVLAKTKGPDCECINKNQKGPDCECINKKPTSFVQLRADPAPEDQLAKEMTHDLEMNFNKIAPFGKEDTAKELQDHAAKTQ